MARITAWCAALQMAEKQALRQAAAVQKLADAAAAALAKQQLEETLKAEKAQRKTAQQQQLQQQKQEVRVGGYALWCWSCS
jgi:ethanolamine utilization protein EutQ (cupin superfamily)